MISVGLQNFPQTMVIDTTQYSVSYTYVDNIVKFGLMYDEPWATKIDLKNAYMSCKVREEDRHLL